MLGGQDPPFHRPSRLHRSGAIELSPLSRGTAFRLGAERLEGKRGVASVASATEEEHSAHLRGGAIPRRPRPPAPPRGSPRAPPRGPRGPVLVPHHPHADGPEVAGPLGIVGPLRGRVVDGAVHLHPEADGGAVEVQDVRPDAELPPPPEPDELSVLQPRPQGRLGGRAAGAEAAARLFLGPAVVEGHGVCGVREVDPEVGRE